MKKSSCGIAIKPKAFKTLNISFAKPLLDPLFSRLMSSNIIEMALGELKSSSKASLILLKDALDQSDQFEYICYGLSAM